MDFQDFLLWQCSLFRGSLAVTLREISLRRICLLRRNLQQIIPKHKCRANACDFRYESLGQCIKGAPLYTR